MKRRAFAAACLALPLIARAQGKAQVIGLLWNDSVKPSPYVEVLTGALRARGYVEGKNLRIEDRVALEGYGPMAENAAALVRAKVDLIVTFGSTATLAAAKATKEIPIVTVIGTDPVMSGLAASLSRPGGNVTGVTTISQGLTGKRIELLKELVPGLNSVGILGASGAADLGRLMVLEEARAATRALKLNLHLEEIRQPEDIEPSVAALAKARVGAICVLQGTQLVAHNRRVVAAITGHRIPAIYALERYADVGGLMVYAASTRKAFVQAAGYVERILRGAKPGEMPIEQMSEVELVINLKTAKTLGIRIPQSILQRADRAIE